MLRNSWFWITVFFIVVGIILTTVLGVFHWLVGALAVAALVLIGAFIVAAYGVKRVGPLQVPRLQEVLKAERISVIYDCDVMMGRPFQDVGDGLVLLYLLGEPRVYLRFVTTTYGNGPVNATTRVARSILGELDQDDVAVIPGASAPDEGPEENRAAQYLVDTVGAHPGTIALIATGSMTNLKHAVALDPKFFHKLRGLYLLGGIIGPLTWNGHRMAEQNFSLDPEAAYLAIHADCPVTLVSGEAGLTAIFRSPQYAALQAMDDPVSRFVARRIRFWFALTRLWFQDGGFGMWDSIPALALTRPGLLNIQQAYVTSTQDDLRHGRLFVDLSQHGPVRLVTGVRDFESFILTHFAAWHHLGRRVQVSREKRRRRHK